ncbi:guanine nucleotide exchange factor DBS-like isoform X2 [Styela clava]
MDWEEVAISELYQRFESIYRSVDKVVYPGLFNCLPHNGSGWSPLNRGIACLTGGTDRFGSPIIYIPNNARLDDTSESDFRGIIKYLVAATNASSADVGFVVVIDSRQSRWSCLAWILRNVATSFPGELKMILALRPTSILHGTLSTIAMRYQKDEYNYKIELLGHTESIWPWIAKSDLPREIGGLADYNHTAWLKKRQLIENLATLLKRVIQRCKSYSVELINEHIVPEEICEQKVALQNIECERVMAEIDMLNKEGHNALFDEIWQTEMTDKESVSVSVKDIAHLRSLISEVKDTFGNFWKTYETKRDGYLQLKSFEKNYKNAASRISCLIEDLEYETGKSEMTIIGDFETIRNLSHYSSQEKTADMCIQACADGEGLMRDHPYAVDCIKPKCEELKRLSHCYQNLMEEKLQNDLFLNRIKESIREVNEWSNAGMKLLSVQNLEKAKSSVGLSEALDELESFTTSSVALDIDALRKSLLEKNHVLDHVTKPLDDAISQFDLVFELFEKRKAILKLSLNTSEPEEDKSDNNKQDIDRNSKNTTAKPDNTAIVYPILQNGEVALPETVYKLRQVINELVETEKKYVEELQEIVQGYGHAIDDPTMSEFIPESLKENRGLLLGNLEQIQKFHEEHLLPRIIECGNDEIAISELFISKTSDFSLYYEYCHDSNKRKLFRKQIGENHAFFVECQRRLSHRLPLSAYLLKPVQRITKYQLLLQQMQKYSENTKSSSKKTAVDAMMDVLKKLNDSMHEISITGFQEEFSTLGRLLMQGPFQIQMEYKKQKVKDFARSKFNKNVLRQLFLYENGLLICKKREIGENEQENGKSGPKSKTSDIQNTYQFKKHVKASQISVTEVLKGSPSKFKIHCREEDAEIIVTTPSSSIKQNFIKSIQTCINKYRKSNPSCTSPKRVTNAKKRLDPATKPKTATASQNRSKVQRSKSWGKSATQTSSKSFLDRQKSFSVREKVNSKLVSKVDRLGHKDKAGERKSSEEVTFGNIHGVDKSPGTIASNEEQQNNASDVQQPTTERKKKRKNSTKQSRS